MVIQSNLVSDLDSEPSSGIVLIFSTLTSYDNTFDNHTGRTGAYIMATSDSVITDRGSTFKNSVSTVGALGYIVGSSVSF